MNVFEWGIAVFVFNYNHLREGSRDPNINSFQFIVKGNFIFLKLRKGFLVNIDCW